MKLSAREALIAVTSGLIALAGALAARAGSVAGAVVALTVLAMVAILLQLWVLRRVALRQQSLDRIEQKLDVVARRVVTESEATTRELGERLDGLAKEIRRDV
ncbi:MAG: hypothetical protein ACJ71Z_07795 [Aeromicrobium sp.]